MPAFLSAEWIEQLKAAAQTDAGFLENCRRYPGTRFILVCEEDEVWEETVCYYIENDADGLAVVEALDSPLDREADFVVAAPYLTWKEAMQTREQNLGLLLKGRFQVTGDREELLRRARESKGLVRLLGEVETTFDVT
jgi:putative sterol carrier protein